MYIWLAARFSKKGRASQSTYVASYSFFDCLVSQLSFRLEISLGLENRFTLGLGPILVYVILHNSTCSVLYCLICISIQSDLYYRRYLGVLNFGLKNRGQPRSADNIGMDIRGLTVHCTLYSVHHIS